VQCIARKVILIATPQCINMHTHAHTHTHTHLHMRRPPRVLPAQRHGHGHPPDQIRQRSRGASVRVCIRVNCVAFCGVQVTITTKIQCMSVALLRWECMCYPLFSTQHHTNAHTHARAGRAVPHLGHGACHARVPPRQCRQWPADRDHGQHSRPVGCVCVCV
jgi:hypothetical protein